MFKQLFNWIKFKVLPPSVLFSNRLYLERDSKTRRIVTNLGLTFRNAKWLNYQRVSVNVRMKRWFYYFTATLFSLSFLLYLTIFFSKSYDLTLFFNLIVYYYWLFKDFFAYQVFSSLSFISFQGTLILEFFYVNWVGWFFIKNSRRANSVSSEKLPQPPTSQDNKYLLFAWIKESPSFNLAYYQKLFSPLSPNKRKESLNHLDFKSLYSVLSNFLTGEFDSAFSKKRTLLDSAKFLKQELHFMNSTSDRTCGEASLLFLNSKTSWTYTLKNSITCKMLNLPTKKGLFYKTNLTASSYSSLLFPKNKVYSQDELFSVNNFHFKTMRFLYNYSFLHRKVFKDAHKITLTKKLISSGFYTDQSLKKNIWLSDVLNASQSSRKLLKSELELNYGKLFSPQLPKSRLLNIDKLNSMDFTLKNLSFYESSFIWFIKRLENLTLLKTQKTLLSWNPNTELLLNQTKENSPVPTDFTKSGAFLNFFLNYESSQTAGIGLVTPQTSLSNHSKGLKLSTFELDLLTQEDENIMIEFVGNAGGQENAFTFWYKKPQLTYSKHIALKSLPSLDNVNTNKKTKVFGIYLLHSTFLLDLINFFKVTV